MGKQKFCKTFNKTALGLTADVTCQPNIFTPVIKHLVPAQSKMTWGGGFIKGGVDAREVMRVELEDTSGDLDGDVRFELWNHSEKERPTIIEKRTEELRTSPYIKFGESNRYSKEDSYIVISFKPDGAAAKTVDFDAAGTAILAPVTTIEL